MQVGENSTRGASNPQAKPEVKEIPKIEKNEEDDILEGLEGLDINYIEE